MQTTTTITSTTTTPSEEDIAILRQAETLRLYSPFSAVRRNAERARSLYVDHTREVRSAVFAARVAIRQEEMFLRACEEGRYEDIYE